METGSGNARIVHLGLEVGACESRQRRWSENSKYTHLDAFARIILDELVDLNSTDGGTFEDSDTLNTYQVFLLCN